MSELALELVIECLEEKNPYLDLGNCGLSDEDFADGSKLSKTLSECIHLTSVILSNSWLDLDASNDIVIHSANKGESNSISNIPTPVQDLHNLQILIFANFDNSELQHVDLKNLIGLKGLTTLSLSGRKFNISELGKLTLLKKLDVSRTGLTNINALQNLSQLTILALHDNNIRKVDSLAKLIRLKKLYLGVNKISNIDALKSLTNLTDLFLHGNNLKTIDALADLKKLVDLTLSENSIEAIDALGELTNLKRIVLDENRIFSIKPLLPLLKKNRFNGEFINIPDKKRFSFSIEENPLTIPPMEIVVQGVNAISNYLAELEKQGIEYLYEAKMLIVGQPRAGKTSLRYKLADISAPLPEEDGTTRGIDIKKLDFDFIDKDGNQRNFFYNVWDFGGQHIYQTTHQFFLTHRSLYVLVMDTGKDSIGNDDNTINYWLQALELLGGKSPLLLVRNEKGDRKINIDIPQKRARFDFLKMDYGLNFNALIKGKDSFDGVQLQKFEVLKRDIQNELSRLPLVGFPMPKNWVQVRNELQEEGFKHHFITTKEFIAICERYEVINYDRQMELSRIFHDLGIFLHFQGIPALEDFIILQNTWATDAVFAVLDNEEVQKNKGRFSFDDLARIWGHKTYEPAAHGKLLQLMMQFELCYQIEKSSPGVYIIPEMLADTSPSGCVWQPDNDLPLRYKYDFMPKGILTRFIVRMHRSIFMFKGEQAVWKTGVKIDGNLLYCPNTEAEIIEAWDNKQLDIKAHGPFAKDLITRISQEIDQLNNEYFRHVSQDESAQKSRWYKMVPCNCVTCQKVEQKHFYRYDDLLKRKSFGKDTIECEKEPFAAVNIPQLLDGVFTKNETSSKRTKSNAIMKYIKIFVSYSNKDRELRELLVDGIKEHLDNKKDIKYDIWADNGIDLGANWREEIENALKESNTAILLVSASFASSKFIKEIELAEFLRRKKEEGYLILPVLIRNYDFSEFETLSSVNFFKTFYKDYGYNKPIERNKFFPFDVLAENDVTTDKQLQDYYKKLAEYIHTSVTNHLGT